MPIFCVKCVKIYTGQKNLHWRRQPHQRQLSGMENSCEDVPILLTPSWWIIPLIITRPLGDVGQCGGKEFKRTPGEGSSGPSPWLREKVRSKVGRFPGFGLFSEARARMGRPPTERRPIREYGRKPNILLSPGWDNMSSSSSLSRNVTKIQYRAIMSLLLDFLVLTLVWWSI